MKNLNSRILIGIIIMSLFIFGCKKDEENDKDSYFSLGGNTYKLAKGFIEEYGANSDGNSADFDVILMSSTINYNESTEEFSGTGDAIYMDLNSPSINELVAGTYNYDQEYYYLDTAVRKPNTLVDGGVFIDFDVQTENGTYYETDENSTGTVIIKKSGNNYEISFNFTVGNNMSVEGNYNGSLQTYDDRKKSDHAVQKKNPFSRRANFE